MLGSLDVREYEDGEIEAHGYASSRDTCSPVIAIVDDPIPASL